MLVFGEVHFINNGLPISLTEEIIPLLSQLPPHITILRIRANESKRVGYLHVIMSMMATKTFNQYHAPFLIQGLV